MSSYALPPKQANKTRRERGRADRNHVSGAVPRSRGCQAGRGGRREDVTEKRGSAGGKAWEQDGLAASGAGKFYTLSCFMVPFTGEQV